MKKNTLNRILFFILGGIFFSCISVYAATTILSKDIQFTPSNPNWEVNNVEEAIDDLYKETNSKMSFKLRNDNYTTTNSNTIFNTGNKYNFFKITDITKNDNVDNCYTRAWSIVKNSYINIDIDKEYKLHDQEYDLTTIEVVSNSKSNSSSTCTISVELYN